MRPAVRTEIKAKRSSTRLEFFKLNLTKKSDSKTVKQSDHGLENTEKHHEDFGTHESKEHVLCCQCTWQLEVKQCSGPGLIQQQQPTTTCLLLTDLWGFVAA